MTTLTGRGAPVVVTQVNGVPVRRPRSTNAATRRVSHRIVHVVMLATSAFALLDLSLLVSSLHH
jgi:hypothetical protein